MNYKRAIGFGILLWVFIFVIYSILIFIPALKEQKLTQNIIFWVLNVPLTLSLAKWYFIKDVPNIKKGLYLGLIGLAVGTILDLIITVPFFIKSYTAFYSEWMLYFGYIETLLLCIFAGAEFDLPLFRREGDNGVDKTPKI